MAETVPYSPLDVWRGDFEDDPWSLFALSHQTHHHDAKLARLNMRLSENDLLLGRSVAGPLIEIDSSLNTAPDPDLCYVGTYSEVDDEQEDCSSEAAALEDLVNLTEILARYQNQHGKTAKPTLQKEFELAKALEKNGHYDEAEYHCRRIIETDPKIHVRCCLGLILAKTSRLEESISILFSAITLYIIHFHYLSEREYTESSAMIGFLFNELSDLSESNWRPFLSCSSNMMDTVQRALSEGETLDEISVYLFACGFFLARKCSIFGFIDSAKHMYQVLLEHSGFYIGGGLNEMVKAKAHQRYGRLLRKEAAWTSSAEQLLLSCESAISSGSPDTRLIELLEEDFIELSPHLIPTIADEEPVAAKIQNALTEYRGYIQMSQTPKSGLDLRINDYFDSELPPSFVNVEALVNHCRAQVETCLRINRSRQGDEERTSTTSGSMSERSYPYGLTYSNSTITGVSISGFLVA